MNTATLTRPTTPAWNADAVQRERARLHRAIVARSLDMFNPTVRRAVCRVAAAAKARDLAGVRAATDAGVAAVLAHEPGGCDWSLWGLCSKSWTA